MRAAKRTVFFVYPGDINTLTGGYRYDKRVIQGLQNVGWDVHSLSLQGHYPDPSVHQLEEAFQQLNQIPDGSIVIIDGLAYGAMPQQMASLHSRASLIALVHHPLALETGLSAETARRLADQEAQALTHADLVITTSQDTARSLQDYGVSDARTLAIAPGADEAPQASNGTGTFQLLCVATLTKRKGHAVLLDALHMNLEEPWQLTCVGSKERDDVTWDALQAQQIRLGLQDRIDFLGEVSEDQLRRCYQQADLFVLASYHEGYGMVLSEAIAHGLPIVACESGAIADTVPKQAGILVPTGDAEAFSRALRQFMQSATTRSALRTGAQQARWLRRDWCDVINEFDKALTTLPEHPSS